MLRPMCSPTALSRGLRFTLILGLLLATSLSASAQPHLYWSDLAAGKVQRSQLDGSAVEDIVTPVPPVERIHFDATDGILYWSDPANAAVLRSGELCGLASTAGIDEVAAVGGLGGIAVDTVGGKVYMADGPTIRRADLDGTGLEDLYDAAAENSDVRGLALDATAGKLYWVETHDVFGRVRRSNLDGTGAESLVAQQSNPGDVALDVAGGKVYWTRIVGQIHRANLDGSSVEQIVNLRATSIEVDVLGGKVYVIHTGLVAFGPRRIGRFDLDGSNAELDPFPGVSPDDISLDAAAGKIYWSENGVVHRANLDDTDREVVFGNTSPEPESMALDVEGDRLYFGGATASVTSLDGICLDPLADIADPEEFSLDAAAGRLYWTTSSDHTVRSTPVDGSSSSLLISEPSIQPVGVAVDPGGGKLYWTNVLASKIQRSNLDGSGIEDVVTTGIITPRGIALDLQRGRIYWTDRATDKIQRSRLDGSAVEDLVTTGLFQAEGIALDVDGGKMYWADRGLGIIERANLDGSSIESLVGGLGDPSAIGLSVSAASPTPVCPATPVAGCRTSQKATLSLVDDDLDERDKFGWRWIRGASTSQAEFADPTEAAVYRLCLYMAGSRIADTRIFADPVKWQAIGTSGYRYSDRIEDGVQRVTLKGHPSDRARITLKGRGGIVSDLAPGTLPFEPADFPITVQLVHGQTGLCWEASFSEASARKNSAERFRATAN